jgi:nucleoside-diphosphate-sugar epimerase
VAGGGVAPGDGEADRTNPGLRPQRGLNGRGSAGRDFEHVRDEVGVAEAVLPNGRPKRGLADA